MLDWPTDMELAMPRVEKALEATWRRAKPNSLRSQLILSVWLGMASVFIPFNLYTFSRDSENILRKETQRLEDQGQIISYLMYRWTLNLTNLIELSAQSETVRKEDTRKVEEYFARAKRLYPKREWALFDTSGLVVTSTKTMNYNLRKEIGRKPFFKQALKGEIGIDISPQCFSEEACVMVSSPVYGATQKGIKKKGESPSGVLVMTVDLTDSAEDSGTQGEFERLTLGESRISEKEVDRTLSFQNKQVRGTEVLMVDIEGHALFPLTNVNDEMSLLGPSQILNTAWAPIIKQALKAEKRGRVSELVATGEPLLLYTERISPYWSVVVVADKKTSLEMANNEAKTLVERQLIFLVLVSLMIAAVCQQAAKPVLKAAATLKEFGKGNFEARINVSRKDEIGTLFDNINETGSKLLGMVNERLGRAVTDKQIETAKEIQKEFIVREQLSGKDIEIAADFDPAYEIGADWYDVIHKGEVTYIVIADVCDKGIPSALFMSVFRSLMRYCIGDNRAGNEQDNERELMKNTIQGINVYMSENHGSSAMFATVFMAAYRKGEKSLSYINAGHESPLVIRDRETEPNERLETCGPAVGIFKEAVYAVKTAEYGPGDVLFCFTDGLVDARSTSGDSFGIDRLKQLLDRQNTKGKSAQEILDQVNAAVEKHSIDAEQFDDKTLLVMKARKSSTT